MLGTHSLGSLLERSMFDLIAFAMRIRFLQFFPGRKICSFGEEMSKEGGGNSRSHFHGSSNQISIHKMRSLLSASAPE